MVIGLLKVDQTVIKLVENRLCESLINDFNTEILQISKFNNKL